MKNKLKYLICLFAFLFLTACGGVVNTTLSFDDSFAGSRVMTYTISNSDFTSYVQKNLSKVESTLRGLCPQDMEITSVTQGDNNIVAVFTINFTSEDDYKTKVSNILSAAGSGIVPDVKFLKSKAVFAKGIAYQENFGSDDLLKWMSDGIMSNEFVTSSYEPYIFSSSFISLNINGEEYEKDASMSIIDVNAAKYLPIDSVDFNTVLNKDGTVDRTIELKIPDSTFENAEDEIEQFMASRVSNVGGGTWVKKDSLHIFTIEGKGLNSDECKKMTESFTGRSAGGKNLLSSTDTKVTEDEAVKDEKMSEEAALKNTSDRKKLFFKNYKWLENVNLEDYISNSEKCVRFNYYVNSQNDYSGTVTFDQNDTVDVSAFEEAEDSNILLFSGYSKLADLDIDVSILPNVSKYKHLVDITPTGKVKRNITVIFKDSFSENDVKELREKLKTAFAKSKIKLDKIELKGSDLEVRLSSKGNIKEDAKMWEDATGYSRSGTSLDIDKKGYLASRQTVRFTDDFHPELFSPRKMESYEYRVKNAGKPLEKDGYMSGGFDNVKAQFSGDDFVIKGDNVAISRYEIPSFRSIRINFIKYIILAVVALMAALIIATVLITHIRKSKKGAAE